MLAVPLQEETQAGLEFPTVIWLQEATTAAFLDASIASSHDSTKHPWCPEESSAL